ncbi:hypothetical protein [Nitrincola tapanii]|uniref:Uncharacterized protein n=1 Tax=Nitrincola tapanii TaxID=1708751 RepID=A0A5A9W3K1_9GAMM|nr:hypothetical protein [Nitrincola tapanii]KAA0874705.1 hypothetical protein E1H14_07765 [Nitrincola tapanii]
MQADSSQLAHQVPPTVQQKIERLTASLPQAVRGPRQADFGFLLSLIASQQELRREGPSEASGAGFQLPESAVLRYPHPDSLVTPQVVERLNTSVRESQRGELAYWVSHLEVKARMPLSQPLANDRFAKMSLASLGGELLKQIEASESLFQAVA